jgi:hypothetical protein
VGGKFSTVAINWLSISSKVRHWHAKETIMESIDNDAGAPVLSNGELLVPTKHLAGTDKLSR